MEQKIVACEIERKRYTNEVFVTYEDGSSEVVFTYYPDELYFSEQELIGLTRKQAQDLHYQKDKTYLRS